MPERGPRPRAGAGSNEQAIRLAGRALHAGVPVCATLVRREGPLAFAQRGREVPLRELKVARVDQGVALAGKGIHVDLVEHMMAALGAFGIFEGICVAVEGPELPLLDGGARRWAESLSAIGLPIVAAARPRIVRSAAISHGGSKYRFSPAPSIALDVRIAFEHRLIGVQRASWNGEMRDFVDRIAGARTFGFVREHAALLGAGRARAPDLAAIIAFTDEDVVRGCRPPEPDEAARHKLLDLIGDLACYGGPFLGSLEVERPGHRATHAVVAEALRTGVVERPTF